MPENKLLNKNLAAAITGGIARWTATSRGREDSNRVMVETLCLWAWIDFARASSRFTILINTVGFVELLLRVAEN